MTARTLRVDLSRDDIDMRRLRRRERILVVGVTGLEPGVFTARDVVLENWPAASPGYSYRPQSRDDCKNDGWRRFTHPTFRNQGDCVSFVNQWDR